MPLGTNVGLDPDHIMLDGDPTPPRMHSPRNFWPMSVVAKRLDVSKDAIWYGGRPRPRPHCVRWGPSSPKPAQLLNFRPTSIVAERSPISATAEHLLAIA